MSLDTVRETCLSENLGLTGNWQLSAITGYWHTGYWLLTTGVSYVEIIDS